LFKRSALECSVLLLLKKDKPMHSHAPFDQCALSS
jgi:hypothetical protein